ncbi:MAG TPA: hypothetical protein VN285_09490 [Candidatus Deferrimicrobium sp.]|nr:hypothetical protein [Candidatus Deferrimicrobium sp.]
MKLCNKQTLSGVILGTLLLVVSPGLLQGQTPEPFPAQDDDYTTSLGIFRIYVMKSFRPMINDWAQNMVPPLPTVCTDLTRYGCYDPVTGKLTSPVLYDGETIIGRSNAHDDVTGEGASQVGLAFPRNVSDADFKVPATFEGPPDGHHEIHTAVVDMEMGVLGITKSIPTLFVMVRAGHALSSSVPPFSPLPLCPGEVEATPGGNDLPDAESFFNVYAEVIIPELPSVPWQGKDMVLVNSKALLIQNKDLDTLPPVVVYTHENSFAVPVRFAEDNLPLWKKGALFGYMTLAGHGLRYGPPKDAQAGIDDFLAIMNQHLADKGEMPLPKIPTLTEWGMILFCVLLFGWMALVIVRRRRRVTVGM